MDDYLHNTWYKKSIRSNSITELDLTVSGKEFSTKLASTEGEHVWSSRCGLRQDKQTSRFMPEPVPIFNCEVCDSPIFSANRPVASCKNCDATYEKINSRSLVSGP